MLDRIYSTRQAAELLGLSPQTLRNQVSQGAFKADETWRESRSRRVFTEKGLQRFRDERRSNDEKLGSLFPKKPRGSK